MCYSRLICRAGKRILSFDVWRPFGHYANNGSSDRVSVFQTNENVGTGWKLIIVFDYKKIKHRRKHSLGVNYYVQASLVTETLPEKKNGSITNQ